MMRFEGSVDVSIIFFLNEAMFGILGARNISTVFPETLVLLNYCL